MGVQTAEPKLSCAELTRASSSAASSVVACAVPLQLRESLSTAATWMRSGRRVAAEAPLAARARARGPCSQSKSWRSLQL